MLTLNNKALKIGNKWILPVQSGGVVPPAPTVYQVTTSATHGTVTASPTEGTTGTEITLSNTPDTHYHFGSYSVTGATLKNTNQFDIADSDVMVVGNFVEDTKYNVTVNQSTGGTISASPTTGYTGTEVTLSNTPATHYSFGSYNLTGATLKSANKFDIGTSNVTVGATWIEDTKYTVTCTNDGHGTIAASPTSNYSGNTVTLSNTPNSGYEFDSYTLVSGTGASISGNTLTIGTSNVTVRGDFVAQGATYDAYRILITSELVGNPDPQTGFKTLAGTSSPPVKISNLNKTASAGAYYYAGSFTLSSSELSAMSSSSGFTSAYNVQSMVFETSGGSSNVKFDIALASVPQSGYTYTGTIVLQGKSGSTYTTLCTKTYTYGINGTSVSLNAEQQPYRQYQLYCEVVTSSNNYSLMTPVYMNHLSFTPDYISGRVGQEYSWYQIPGSTTVINQLTSTDNSTYFTYGDNFQYDYEGIYLRFTSNNKIDSASFTLVKAEFPTGWPYTNYKVNYRIIALDLNGTASSGSVSKVAKNLKVITQTSVNNWPTNLSISV